jgi:hypothetical protein
MSSVIAARLTYRCGSFQRHIYNPMRGSILQIDRHPGRKGGTAIAVRKGIPCKHVDLPLVVSVEATAVCIPIGNKEILLAGAYKSPGRTWSDADKPYA